MCSELGAQCCAGWVLLGRLCRSCATHGGIYTAEPLKQRHELLGMHASDVSVDALPKLHGGPLIKALRRSIRKLRERVHV